MILFRVFAYPSEVEAMSQRVALVGALKQALKARDMTYARLAKGLGLSEASVKRVFATGSLTLERLDRICELIGIEISDLARMVSQEVESAQLSWEQEQGLVSDPKLLLVAVHAVNHWTFDELVESYTLTKAECIRLLARLDKLGIIDLLPNNKIRVRVPRDFAWLPGGPIQQYFRARIQNDFLRSRFDQEGELMLFVSGILSRSSNTVIQSRMRRLAAELAELHHQDLSSPRRERFGTGLILAMRPWTPQSFERFSRKRREPRSR
jgi:DNA-binding Xre family transcriptional regulator